VTSFDVTGLYLSGPGSLVRRSLAERAGALALADRPTTGLQLVDRFSASAIAGACF